jgi:hypothetical protein
MGSARAIERYGSSLVLLPMLLLPMSLLLVAALLLAPSLVLGTLNSHSSPQNLTWASQFADQFRAGILYPRALPDSYDGLGGAGFYFYPPIAFWLDAVLSVVTFDQLSVSWRLSLAALLLLWASGLAMHAWLREAKEDGEGASPRIALLGALTYMAAPYHLVDHYWRGAYAEFAAYVVLPLLMLAVRRVAEGRRFGVVFLAVAYAALPMTHLPTSLLISATALPMYVLWCAWRMDSRARALGFLARAGLGGALGLGLAAIYLIPALALQGWIPADTFWAASYRIELWYLLTPARWPAGVLDMMLVIGFVAAAYGLAAAGVLLAECGAQARRKADGARRREAAFWAALAVVCLLLIAGAVPWFWDLPFLAKVQFPWRLMIVVEFAAISALCLMDWRALAGRPSAWPARIRVAAGLLGLAALAVLPALDIMVAGIGFRIQDTHDRYEAPADLKQFQPAGYPRRLDGGYADLNLGLVEAVPPIACTPAARLCRADAGPFGSLRIEIDADQATEVVVRRFYYPFWRLVPALPVGPTDTLQLVSFVVPAGHHVWRLERAAVAEEKVGWVVSGLSLMALLGALMWGLRGKRWPKDWREGYCDGNISASPTWANTVPTVSFPPSISYGTRTTTE